MDIFADEEEQIETPIAEEQPEAETPQADIPRDDKGRFAPKGETEGSSPEPVAEEPAFDHAAVIGERKRRQEAEARAKALEEQLQAYQNPPEPPAPPPSVWEDEQAFAGTLVSTAVQQATLNARLDMSEMMVRQSNPDFDEMKARFLKMAEVNPVIAQQCLADAHPWNKAYQIAKNAATMEELAATNVSELEAKLRAKIEAELAAQKPPAPALPNSLADAPAGMGTTATGAQPFTLEDIIGR